MSSEKIISVQNISKKFEMFAQPKDRLLQFLARGKKQYYKEFWALRNVSFDVEKGETIGILGRNGSGKSTLLQIIAGTLMPTSGRVQTHGVLTALLELGSGFNPDFTGRENIYLNGSILGFTRHEIDEKFDDIAAFADIGEHLDQPVKTYSSGMYVRLAFAVQACVRPQILIVDEALSVGDEKFQRKCFNYIEDLRSEGCSVLLVTHSTATVEKFCQRGVLLHKGSVHGVGPAKEIVDQYHALLYSDERTYLRYINSQTAVNKVDTSVIPSDQLLNNSQNSEPVSHHIKVDGIRAMINNWSVSDQFGQHTEVFNTGESVLVNFQVDVFDQIDEIQAGILIRTIEGVTAYGTSTLYHNKNFTGAIKGSKLKFGFEVKLDLCPGTYFITLALAEAVSHGDMNYLDRKTDVVVLKVDQIRLTGTGIASLKSNVTVDMMEKI